MRRAGLAEATIVNYLADLRAFARWLGQARGQEFHPAQIGRRDIEHYCSHLRSTLGRTSSTINRRLQALRRFGRFAVETGLAQANPASLVKPLPNGQASPRRLLTAAEAELLLKAVAEDRGRLVVRDRAIILLLLQVGLRVSELVQLHVEDLRLDGHGRITVRGENGHADREVPLSRDLRDAVSRYLAQRPGSPANDFLFLSQEGNRLSARSVQRLVRQYATMAHLDGVTAQSLRHTCATVLLQRSGDPRQVAQWLGHRCPSNVTRYRTSTES